MNRGRRREKIFSSPEDYELFIAVLGEAVEMWNLKIAAYCLMSNHYHLLLHTPDGNISCCMRHINGVYTQRYNRLHKKDGQLFRGRYKAVTIGGDSYLLEVLRYIHRNPLKARLVNNLDDFIWSSHKGYTSRAKKWNWLYKDFMLSMFSEKAGQAKKAYLEFVSQKEPEEIDTFYAKKNLSSVLGSDEFKEWIKVKFEDLRFHREIPETSVLAPEPENIFEAVCRCFETTKGSLMKSRRGSGNLARDSAVYFLRKYSTETLTGVGRYFDIANYSTVSSILDRVKNRKSKDKAFAKQLKNIEKILAKSQRET
jgi:REP element-mobilizing transposase RayT